MVPIYETDLTAEPGLSPADWRNYELWEKIELRRRRARRFWVLGTLVMFLALLSIPTVVGSRGKWRSQVLARELAQALVELKKDAAVRRMPQLITFGSDGSLRYQVETVLRCNGVRPSAEVHESPRTGTLRGSTDDFVLIEPSEGEKIGVPGLVNSFCYNPIVGSPLLQGPESAIGFGVAAVKDLAEGRTDRIAVVLLKGESAEISFN